MRDKLIGILMLTAFTATEPLFAQQGQTVSVERFIELVRTDVKKQTVALMGEAMPVLGR